MRNHRLATTATGDDYRAAWLAADHALQNLQCTLKPGDRAEALIVLARQRIGESQALVWESEPERRA